MPKSSESDIRQPESSDAIYPIRCVRCGEDLRVAGWKSGPVVHCTGGFHVFGNWRHSPHHGHRFVLCKRCRGVLGCDVCLTKSLSDIACTRCDVDGNGRPVQTEEGLAEVHRLTKEFLERT